MYISFKYIIIILLVSTAPFLSGQENNIEFILNEVAGNLSRREFSTALEWFTKMEPQEAEKTEMLILRANILNSAGRPAEARRIAESITEAEPNNTNAWMVLADTAALQGRDRDRRTILERVINIDPGHTRALNDLGNISIRNRNLRAAAGYFDRALAADPNNADALVGRATVHRYNREPREAERLLNRAAVQYPDWAGPLHERARLYHGAGFNADALRDLDAAKALEPFNYWISVDRGLVLIDLNRKQDALEEFTRAIEIEPDHFIAYVYSAGIKMEFGDYEGALRDNTILARLQPEYYFASEAMGMLHMKQKQWAQARDAFLEAYRHAPTEYNYALLAAVNWMRAGRITDPRQFLALVLRTVPRDSIEFPLLRLYHDLSGDLEIAVRIEEERDPRKKSQMLFYLASYYDVRGNTNLANRYYLMVQDLDSAGSIEWQLNEWILAERGLGIRAGQ